MIRHSEFQYDFFISYSSVDHDWVQNWLLPRLEEAGLRGCIDFRDFGIGVTALDNMEDAVKRSRHTIMVLTPEWVESVWAGFEELLALSKDPANRKRVLIPILLRTCKIPERITLRTYADFRNEDTREIQLQRVIEAVREEISTVKTDQSFTTSANFQPSYVSLDLEDPLFSLRNRLITLLEREQIPIVCIGSVYLDIIIHDVELDENQKHYLDFSREVPVHLAIHPGGSIYHVARYLTELGRRPLVVSHIGDGSMNGFADKFFELANGDKMNTAVRTVTRQRGTPTAVTIHFVSSEVGGTAMYTDRGLLKQFGWREALKILHDLGREHQQIYDNGIIYIAGFLKTSLDDHFHENLKRLRQNGAVILFDPGRLEPDQSIDGRARILNLAEALQLVDVYFSTIEEFAQLIAAIAKLGRIMQPIYHNDSLRELIDHIVQDRRIELPPIMLFKDRTGRPRIHKIAIRNRSGGYEWRDIRVPGHTLPMKRRYIVGSSNAFNAAFIDCFLNVGSNIDIDTLAKCAESAHRGMVKAETEG
jgi:sugar/nucleoside kinase (ribokinase family)